MVLVTGTTGALGSHILKHLLLEPEVVKVFAYNRSPSIAETQRAAFASNGLDADLLDSPKLRYICGNMDEPMLGLTALVYNEVCTFQSFRDSVTEKYGTDSTEYNACHSQRCVRILIRS